MNAQQRADERPQCRVNREITTGCTLAFPIFSFARTLRRSRSHIVSPTVAIFIAASLYIRSDNPSRANLSQ